MQLMYTITICNPHFNRHVYSECTGKIKVPACLHAMALRSSLLTG